jgi:signal transduction histidine kinase
MHSQDFAWEAREGPPVPSWQAEYDRHTLRTTHQLKAPLDIISGNISLVLDGSLGELSEEIRTILTRTDDRAKRMSQMLLDMEHLTRLEGRAPDPKRFVMTEIEPMVRTCVEELRPSADRRGVGLRLTLVPLAFLCVPEQLHLLLKNLLSNAITYSHDHGEVQVSCGQERTTSQGMVAIADGGIGIPAEALPHLFDDHFRTKESIRHNHTATGLGLAIVKHVARNHALRLRVASEPGQGTTFTVLFPVTGTPEAGVAART